VLSIPRIARRLPHAVGTCFNKRASLSIGGALVVTAALSLQVITVPTGAAYGEGSCTVLRSGAVVCKTGGGGGPGTTTTTPPPAEPPSPHIPPYYIVFVPCDECVSGGTDEICTSHGTVGFDPDIPADWVPGDPLPDGDTLLQLEEEISSTTGRVLGVVPDSAPNVGQPCNGPTTTAAAAEPRRSMGGSGEGSAGPAGPLQSHHCRPGATGDVVLVKQRPSRRSRHRNCGRRWRFGDRDRVPSVVYVGLRASRVRPSHKLYGRLSGQRVKRIRGLHVRGQRHVRGIRNRRLVGLVQFRWRSSHRSPSGFRGAELPL